MRKRDGVVVAVLVAAAVTSFLQWKRKQSKEVIMEPLPLQVETKKKKKKKQEGVLGAIGDTPLIRIRSLSEATSCEIYGKCEFLNPGGSVKDRVAAKIVEEALESGALRVGGVITEGSAGSTAVSLAMVASAYGCKCLVVLPDDAAIEKTQILEAMGATVERVRPVSITHNDHFVNVARRRALEARAAKSAPESVLHTLAEPDQGLAELEKERDQELEKLLDQQVKNSGTNPDEKFPSSSAEFRTSVEKEIVEIIVAGVTKDPEVKEIAVNGEAQNSKSSTENGTSDLSHQGGGGYFADQFENLANFRAHYEGTGPEIWEQCGGNLHAFVAAAGTGGTIAGVSRYLKEKNPFVRCYLIDPPGSGLYYRITRGVMYTKHEAEGKRKRNPFDTITEGIGINRITENFKQAQIDGAFRGTDQEAVEMARYLMKNDGLFVGSSSAMNCVGAVRVAQQLGPGHTIVTILCDGGARHLSKFQNPDYLAAHNLTPTASSLEFLEPRITT